MELDVAEVWRCVRIISEPDGVQLVAEIFVRLPTLVGNLHTRDEERGCTYKCVYDHTTPVVCKMFDNFHTHVPVLLWVYLAVERVVVDYV